MSRSEIERVVAATTLAAAAAWVVLVTFLPEPDSFATTAALGHVAEIASAPHPVGSVRQGEVADYLMDELSAMGVEAAIVPGTVDGRRIQNVVARLDGTASTGTVLVVTHYDSVPAGPGAGDNATGVAVVLESLRSLASANPRNEVVVLFEDGEEFGYLGGFSFARTGPEVGDVAAVVGIDTGAWGPAYVLDVAPADGAIVSALRAMEPAPLGDSLFAAMNIDIGGDDHEATLFMDLGIPGVAIEDITASSRKHTADDSTPWVRPGAVAHLGSRVESLLGELAEADLSRQGGDSVWFRLPFLGVVSHPQGLWPVVAVLGLAASGAAVALRRRLAWRSVGALVARSVGAIGTVVVAGIVATALFEISNGTGLNVQPSLMWLWAVGHAVVGAGVTAAFVLPALRRSGHLETAIASVAIVTLFTVTMGGVSSRAGYAFAWLLLLVGVGALAIALRPRLGPVALLPAGLGGILLLGPGLVAGYRGSGLTVLGPLALLVTLAVLLALPALSRPAENGARREPGTS